MGAWRFAAPGGFYLFASLAACGGSEFSSDDRKDASVDAASGGTSGAAGSGGVAASAGASGVGGSSGAAGSTTVDAAPNYCTDELFNRTCDDQLVTTGTTNCDSCGRNFCCSEANACLQDQLCSQLLQCYLGNCLGVSGTGCILAKCQPCWGGGLPFGTLRDCLMANCQGDCPQIMN